MLLCSYIFKQSFWSLSKSSVCKKIPWRKHRHRPLRHGPKKSYNHKSYSQGWRQFRRGLMVTVTGSPDSRRSTFLNVQQLIAQQFCRSVLQQFQNYFDHFRRKKRLIFFYVIFLISSRNLRDLCVIDLENSLVLKLNFSLFGRL